MSEKKLSPMEIDAIGEILNISLGASATAVSTMLNARVDITTPVVRVVKKEKFSFSNLKPAIAVEISYIDGLSGKNVMLLKRSDVKVIVEMLMGMTFSDEEFELNEMNVSAISEVMNQMMGSSATALSELFGRAVNISTPQAFEVEGEEMFKGKYFETDAPMVVIGFTLSIEDKMKSEFMNLMSVDLAKELVEGFFPGGLGDSGQEDESDGGEAQSEAPASVPSQPQSAPSASVQPAPAEETLPPAGNENGIPSGAAAQAAPQPAVYPAQDTAAQPQPVPAPAARPQSAPAAPAQPAGISAQAQPAPAPVYGQPSDGVMEQMMKTMQMMQQQMVQMQNAQMQNAQAPRQIPVRNAQMSPLKGSDSASDPDANLDLLMGVPLELSVEIGRTKKLVKDILELNKGSLVVLDRIAGEPVDLFVNGECIAKGDVVVVDDNFGIRITEIVQDESDMEE